jgi:ribosomal protein S18 acetylase RimI-like enzyme
MKTSQGEVDIYPFRIAYQKQVRDFILCGLSERWGELDKTANPDIDDIEASYGSDNFFMACCDGRLVGTGGLFAESSSVVRIVRMWIQKDLRRSGIGTMIMQHLLSQARLKKYSSVVLETTSTWSDAISFYQKQGFEIEEYRDGDTHFQISL